MKTRIIRNISLISVLLIFLSLISPSLILGDGGYFPHGDYWVRSGQQKAIIFHDNNIETMIVTSDFTGNAKDLVWILPTPSIPEVEKANEEIFNNIARLTMPVYNTPYSYNSVKEAISSRDTGGGVVVINSKKVDYYDTDTLSATSSEELVKWFNDNDYTYPEEYAYVLNSYINKGWFFTAVKVSPESEGAIEVIEDMEQGHPTPIKLTFLSNKIVFPLKISSVEFEEGFKLSSNLWLNQEAVDHLLGIDYTNLADSEEAADIFDTIIEDALMHEDYENSIASDYSKIIRESDYYSLTSNEYCNYDSCVRSSLEQVFRDYFSRRGIYLNYGSDEYIPIQLYIISNAKTEAPGNFYVQYANWVKASKIEKLGETDEGEPLIETSHRKYFITSMSASYQRSQMDDDLYFNQAEDNKKVNAGPEGWQMFLAGLIISIILLMFWVFTPLGIMFIAGSLMVFLSKNRGFRVFGWIIEIISLVITFLITVIFGIMAGINGSLSNYLALSMLLSFLFLILVMAVLVIAQLKIKR